MPGGNPTKPSDEPTQAAKEQRLESEMRWVQRYDLLKSNGYLLRPRYRPDWVASWTDNPSPAHKDDCEDGISHMLEGKLDARRISDGIWVFLKEVSKSSNEETIGRFLSDEPLRSDPRNHSIPLLDSLEDNVDPDRRILVFPLLRRIDSPDPASISEAMDLIEQSLQGLTFLHEHGVAHRDCAYQNIMMDGRRLFPDGWHPQSWLLRPDARIIKNCNPSRTAIGGVRYYFIDYGLSTLGQDLVVGVDGLEVAPEQSTTTPYDPYKQDIYIMGMAIQRFFVERYVDMDYLMPFVQYMAKEKPADRPSAVESLKMFQRERPKLERRSFSTRLRRLHADESLSRRVLNDVQYRLSEIWWGATSKPKPLPLY